MEDITPEEYDDAVRILAEELQKYPDMILTFKGFDHESGEIIVRYDISRPIFVMWLLMVGESGMAETYYSNIIEHKWGQHINYGILRKTAGAVRQKLKDNPGFAVDDGISWNDGRKTRDWTKEVIDTFFDFGLRDDDFVILDFNNDATCDCKYCSIVDTTTKKSTVHESFKLAWNKFTGKDN